MGCSWQECWIGLPCPPLGDIPDSGIESASAALAGRFFTAEPLEKPRYLQINAYSSPFLHQYLSIHLAKGGAGILHESFNSRDHTITLSLSKQARSGAYPSHFYTLNFIWCQIFLPTRDSPSG